MDDSLTRLVEAAQKLPVTRENRENQRRSFAFGNTAFENPQITRDLIDREADKLLRETAHDGGRG